MVRYKMDTTEVEEPSKAKKVWQRRSWKEMSPAQRGANIVLGIVELMLTGWALWDIKHRPDDQINGKKRTWVMTSLIQPIGPVIYFIFGRKRTSIPLTA
jgi:hypothetical protein